MSWDDEESDDNNNNVKEDWDDSDDDNEEEEVKKPAETVATPVKKNLTLKQKIAEKEAILKEQKAKKIALVSSLDYIFYNPFLNVFFLLQAQKFMEGETEEERFEKAQKEAGIKKAEFSELEASARK